MSQILIKIQELDPNNSEAIKETIGVFFQNLLKHVHQDCIRWLQALEDVIGRFPKFCINHRATFESYIIKYVDSFNYNHVTRAAKCAHLLQQVKTTNPKLGWKQQMALLCSAAQHLTEKLFSSIVRQEIQLDTAQSAATPLVELLQKVTKVQPDNIDKSKVLLNRLKNIHIFIQAMLVEIYPSAKPIQPQMILDLVVQVLSISRESDYSIEDIVMIKCEALRTLDALIACLGANLIPYSPLVFRLVMQTLRWSSDHSNEHTKGARRHAYSSLRKWLMVLHVYKITDSRNSLEDELTSHIINDITPPTKVVELTFGPQPTRNMSKKAQKKLKARQINDSSLPSMMPKKNKTSKSEEMNNEVAMAALDCLEALFIVCGVFLKPTTHKVLQERLLRDCYNLSSYSGAQGLAILRTLDASRTCGGVRPPTQHCLRIYSEHTTSVHQEIASFCSRALLDIRLHLHCSPPSLNFAVQGEPEKATKKKKRVSEKNRAVLESLLGKDKMPPADVEEIITIPDEPVNKKARLEDDADNYSLSSEHEIMSSVEISDDSGTEDVQEVHQIENESELEVEPITEVQNISQLYIENGLDNTTTIKEIRQTYPNENSSTAEGTSNTENEQNGELKIPGNENVNENEQDDAIIETAVSKTFDIGIHNAPTQTPLNDSTDTLDGDERPHSLEVGYDYPNTGSEKIPVLEKIDDNLPSTNETDDIQITCGQELKSSLDIETEKKSGDVIEETNSPKLNGIQSPEETVQDINIKMSVTECDSTNIVAEKNVLSVEDMMADFVDEVNDDA